ncbi:phosphotransferase family protein [Nocardia pseudovaccinii]|uniref:phosphotransferase family protein n=1 Tax=Nocardia pseudovaccinii TaxID=189540 RepID=UPI003D8C75F1
MTSDPAAGLARFLHTEFGQPVQVSNISGLSTGARRTNVAFDAETSTRTLRLVATFVPNAIELAPVTVEAAVRELARAHGVPVPPVVAVCTDAGYTGAPFLVSERIDGETVPRKVLRLVHAEAIGDRVAEQVGAAMATLHTIDPQLAPPELPGVPTGNPAEQLLTELITGVRTLLGDRPVFTLALRWLVNRLPSTPERRSLLHTDLRNGNLIIGPDGVRAILDWEGAHRFGDPMRDAAWPALRMWRFHEDAREIGGFATRPAFIAGYERAGGTFDPDRFRWWKVACTLWWGIGLASQAAAHLDGTVRSVVMAASGRRISEIEWDLLMQIRPPARIG